MRSWWTSARIKRDVLENEARSERGRCFQTTRRGDNPDHACKGVAFRALEAGLKTVVLVFRCDACLDGIEAGTRFGRERERERGRGRGSERGGRPLRCGRPAGIRALWRARPPRRRRAAAYRGSCPARRPRTGACTGPRNGHTYCCLWAWARSYRRCSVHLPAYLPVSLSTCLPAYPLVCLSTCLPANVRACPPACPVCLSFSPPPSPPSLTVCSFCSSVAVCLSTRDAQRATRSAQAQTIRSALSGTHTGMRSQSQRQQQGAAARADAVCILESVCDPIVIATQSSKYMNRNQVSTSSLNHISLNAPAVRDTAHWEAKHVRSNGTFVLAREREYMESVCAHIRDAQVTSRQGTNKGRGEQSVRLRAPLSSLAPYALPLLQSLSPRGAAGRSHPAAR
eukprot:2181952-Pleurochrysis_carterae.AAC.1